MAITIPSDGKQWLINKWTRNLQKYVIEKWTANEIKLEREAVAVEKEQRSGVETYRQYITLEDGIKFLY